MKTIRELREESGMTQAQLAAALGLAPSTVYTWESGRNEPKASQLRALAALLHVPMDEIAFEAEKAKAARESDSTRRRDA